MTDRATQAAANEQKFIEVLIPPQAIARCADCGVGCVIYLILRVDPTKLLTGYARYCPSCGKAIER